MTANLFKKIYGSSIVLRNLYKQTRIPFLPQEELHRLRDERLRDIIQYAAKTVPYYRTFFQDKKIDPRDIKTAEDLSHLPILDKQTVRKAPHSFVSDSLRPSRSFQFITSGTTGKPLEIYHDLDSLLANIAFGEREKGVVTKILAGLNYRDFYFSYTQSTIHKVRNVYGEWTFYVAKNQKHFFSVLESFNNIIAEINRFKPSLITGYGSFLEILFRTIHQKNIDVHMPKLLMYVAENMTPEGRNFIEETFGIKVLSRYNAMEAFKIGYFCEERNGFHIHEDLCHIKVMDSAGKMANAGEKGEIIISNFVNKGTVLLNYRLRDIASLSPQKCSCGRTFQILSELEGRAEDIVFLPDGTFIHPRAIWKVFRGIRDVLQYQLIQHEPQRFELRLVTVDKKSYDAIVNEISQELKTLLGTSSNIQSDFYSELPREGKFRMVISHCRPF
jgi:phenylacetate-CoA ligase